MSTADAVQREANWLAGYNPNDGLPALTKANGGPWDVVQAYWSPSVASRLTRLFLVRGLLLDSRFSAERRIDSYQFTAKLYWPIGATSAGAGMWEAEQAALDSAVDLVLKRIRGFVFDHTHGTFLSVAEAPEPGHIQVHFADPERSAVAVAAELSATITYSADDRDYTA